MTLVQALVNGILRSGLYALTSSGLALSVGVIGIVNFAHGEFLVLGAYLAYWAFVLAGVDPLLALPLGALLLFALGAGLYHFAVRPVLAAPELNQMLLTFGISVVLQNAALILWRGDPRTINPWYRSLPVQFAGVSTGLGRLLVFLLAAALVTGLFALLSRTRFGQAMRAVSQNREGAAVVGIGVNRTYLLAFGLSAALAGMAGVMLSTVLYAHPMLGLEFTLKAFSIVVMAGLGNLTGVLWASIVLGVAESLVGTYVPRGSGLADSVFFLLILLVLIARPKGLGAR